MKLFRISNFLFLGIAVFFGVLLFWTSQAVQKKEKVLKEARQELMQEQESVRVLAVEWDYLNRPQRLEQLASGQLGMELPSAKEVVRNVNEIPEPIVVNTNPDFFEEGMAQNVSMEQPKPQAKIIPKKETVAPSTAEKQSFEKLIQSLDAGSGQ
jgi:cell division protein FtsL